MKTQEFVDAIRKVVVDATASNLLAFVRSPPGRKPDAEVVALSTWYNGLPEEDKAAVERLMHLTVRHAVLGVFEVLDGAVKVDPSATASDYFELRHFHGGGDDVLSGPTRPPLHELL
jgi:hypothetical protein